MALSKRIKTIKEKIDVIKDYDIEEAIELLKSAPKVKFNESVDLSVNLGIDATKSDQGVRGSSTLPHGIGKNMNVVAFADGEDEKAAKDAGADTVGFEDLIEQVKKDKDLVADIVVATYVNASVVTIPEKVKQWVDATLTSQPDSKGTNDYEKDTRAFYKSELKIKPEPHYVGLESHITSIFTKALHAAFPMLKTIQPISNVCVSHMKADYQCSSAMAAFIGWSKATIISSPIVFLRHPL